MALLLLTTAHDKLRNYYHIEKDGIDKLYHAKLLKKYVVRDSTDDNANMNTHTGSSTVPKGTLVSTNPCIDYVEIDEPRRSTAYVAEAGEPLICDDDFPYPSTVWYRFISGAGGKLTTQDDLPEGSCGTRTPLYMIGGHPGPNETVTREVCGDYCYYSFSVNVTNCGGFFVYLLEQVDDCYMGYCAGTESRCPDGTNSPTGFTPGCTDELPNIRNDPTIKARIDDIYYEELSEYLTIPVIDCDIETNDDGNLKKWFRVTWFVDTFLTKTEDIEDDEGLYRATLTEFVYQIRPGEKTNGLYSLGQTVQCMIEAYFDGSSITSPPRYSNIFYAGIQVEPRAINVTEGDVHTLRIFSTIPIEFKIVTDNDLCLSVGVSSAKRLDLNDCRVYLENNVTGELNVVSPPDIAENDLQKYLIELDVKACSLIQYFRGHKPLSVVMQVQDKKFQYCSAVTDPHYHTFNNRYFDLYQTGDYVLVEEKPDQLNLTRFAVHTRLQKGLRKTSYPSWNCAVAVREGNDVVIVYSCNGRKLRYYYAPNSELCNPAFNVIVSEDGFTHTVYTPSGQKVEIKSSSHYPGFGHYHNVYITVNSVMSSRLQGLCDPQGCSMEKCPKCRNEIERDCHRSVDYNVI
ncbi:von Willebrand factor D and EGF domain-containing protein-like [Saccoglossus kowalevskii]